MDRSIGGPLGAPKTSDVASDVTTEYEEHAQFVKLLLPEGEIDFVVSSNLTDPGYDQWMLLERPVKVEAAAEIVAKKMWHRGDRATPRDLFDLSLVIERDPAALLAAGEFLIRHRNTFIEQLVSRDAFIRQGFSDIRP